MKSVYSAIFLRNIFDISLQKKISDYTKDELRKLIEKEEKDIIAGLKWSLGATAIFAIFGITKF